jgi:brefeldin A-resistance guanine nucleotide exchange factor 1
VLPAEADAVSIAAYLRADFRLDKKEIGDYIGRFENKDVLSAYTKTFDFADASLEEALRQFLTSFR